MNSSEIFCSRCGARLSAKEEGGLERPWCPECGHVVFGRFTIGVGGLLRHEGRVLLVQRGEEPGKGRWTFPGGYVEENESPDTAVAREVLEETGLKVSVTGILAIRHAQGAENQNAYYVFGLRLDGPPGDLRETGDGREVARALFADDAQLETLGDIGMVTRWIIERCEPDDTALTRVPDRDLPNPVASHRWTVLFATGGAGEPRPASP